MWVVLNEKENKINLPEYIIAELESQFQNPYLSRQIEQYHEGEGNKIHFLKNQYRIKEENNDQ